MRWSNGIHTVISRHDIILPLPSDLERPEHEALALVNNRTRLILHNREPRLDMSKPRACELIGLRSIGLHITVRRLEVRLHRLAELLICAIDELERLLAVRIGLERLDAVGDDRVGGEVVEELGRRLRAVHDVCGHFFGCVRHCPDFFCFLGQIKNS